MKPTLLKFISYSLIIVVIIITTLFFFSCKKKKTEPVVNPPVSTTPVIELQSTTPTTVHQFSDSIKFDVKYTDGDGDLGDFSADSLSLVVTDNRNSSLVEKFHIAPAAPANVTTAVQGVYTIVLDHTILLVSSATSETTTFSIKLKDRAGNWSNEVQSGTVTVTQ